MFCNFEKISCEIVNSAVGPDHAKIAIAELKLTLRKYGKEFYAKEQARTKKLANSLVAWSIMKQLYQGSSQNNKFLLSLFPQRISFLWWIFVNSSNEEPAVDSDLKCLDF